MRSLSLLLGVLFMSCSSATPTARPSPRATQLMPAETDWAQTTLREHEPEGPPTHTNALLHQASPYLRQHAHNPVNWQAWGEAAFTEAKRRDLPLFVSIGYAACHWCHVMAHDVFENEEAAAFINEHFVPVKVDREENPEVDAIYMKALVAFTGHGGWPLNVWTDHEGKPFYAASTLLMAPQGARPGFLEVSQTLATAWQHDRDQLLLQGDRVAQSLASLHQGLTNTLAEAYDSKQRLEELKRGNDPQHKGWGRGPKFPRTPQLAAQLELSLALDDEVGLLQVRETLDVLAQRGMRDQLAGGFHRYCVDRDWTVPHFEKMLYDNAQLVPIYLESWRQQGPSWHAWVARDTLDWMLREMQAPDGTFYASVDADDPGGEGHYYTWTPTEIDSILPPEEAARFRDWYGVTARGNFEHGRSILIHDGWPSPQQWNALLPTRAKLRHAREARPRPATDTKRVTSWNAMAILALAQGGRFLGEIRYTEAARRAADALWGQRSSEGLLPARMPLEGESLAPGNLDAQALMALALIELYESSWDLELLDRASLLVRASFATYQNEQGDLEMAPRQRSHLFVRLPAWDESSTPSGAASLLQATLRLRALGALEDLEAPLERAFALASRGIAQQGGAMPGTAIALHRKNHPSPEILLSGQEGDVLQSLVETAWNLAPLGTALARWERSMPPPDPDTYSLFFGRAPSRKAQAYLCHEGRCEAPVDDAESLGQLLRGRAPN